jgi:soluble lytic murein transglycosylase-like protein
MQNIMGGCHYYSDMMKAFGNSDDALLGYAYGERSARRLLNSGYKSANDPYIIMVKAIEAQL